jgi:Cu(I)/Ag(I) efflux system membrane fusion protein
MIPLLLKRLAEHTWLLPVVVLVAVGLGALALRPDAAPGAREAVATLWTCSMHPQVRLDHPGQCPICGMDLVPVTADDTTASVTSDLHTLDPHAVAMAQVETAAVESRALWKEVRTVGKVQLDETAVAYLTARVDGRVDRVFADFPGTVVAPGDHLVSIYSPDLLVTQRELLLNLQLERGRAPDAAGPSPVDATRQRLLLWGITDAQLEEVARTGEPMTHLTVFAPMGGTVIEKAVRAGQYVTTGDALFTIADLSRVWVVIDIYERELAWVRFGQPVELRLESQPGRAFVGVVGFLEPVLDEETRTVRARVMLRNDEGHFKPGMFLEALVRVPIDSDGGPGPTGLEGKHVCPMHPYVVQEGPGDCPVCGMPLEQVPGDRGRPGPVLAVPASAVLTTGVRQLVYVEEGPGVYRRVEPVLGARAGDFYPVLRGLAAGQRVVTRGGFLLDSQAQLSGKPSLLYPEGTAGGTGHEGHGEAPGTTAPPRQATPDRSPDVHEGRRAPPPPADERHDHKGHGG